MQALGRQGVDEPHMNVSEDTYMDSKATIELNNSIQLRKELGKVTKYQKLYDLLKKENRSVGGRGNQDGWRKLFKQP